MLAVKEDRRLYNEAVRRLSDSFAGRERPLGTGEVASAVALIAEALPVKRAYLFGSYARGEQRASSDVDIFIVPDDGFSYSDRTRIHMALERCLGLQSDVLTTLNGCKSRFVDAIKRDAVMVYDRGR